MNGRERIKILASEIKDTALLKIVSYLLTREDMDAKYLNEDKSLKQMVEYIKSEAKKKAKDGMAMIEDDVVYGWAIHYFDEPNDKLNVSDVKKSTTQSNSKSEDKPKPVAEGQLTLF